MIGQWFSSKEKIYLVFLIFLFYKIVTFTQRSSLMVYMMIFGIYSYHLFVNVRQNIARQNTVHVIHKYLHMRRDNDATRLIKNDRNLSDWLRAFYTLSFVDPVSNTSIVKHIARFYDNYAFALRHADHPESVVQKLIDQRHAILNKLHRFYMQVLEKKNGRADITHFSFSALRILRSLGKCIDTLTLKYALPDARGAQPVNVYGDEYDIY